MQFHFILHLCLCHQEAFRWGRKRHEQHFHSCAGNKVQHHLTFAGSAFGCVFTTSSTRATTSPLSRCVAWASSENILLHQRVAGATLALRGRSNCTCTCKRRRTQECKARTACLMISLDWSLCFVCVRVRVCVCVSLSLSLSYTTSIPQMLYRNTDTIVFVLFCSLSLSLFSRSFATLSSPSLPSRRAQKASSRQSEQTGKRHTNKACFRDSCYCCRPVSIYFHLLLCRLSCDRWSSILHALSAEKHFHLHKVS